VTSVTVTDGTYGVGDQIDLTVTLDEDIIVDTANGTPRIAWTIGTTTRYAGFTGVVGSVVTFSYTIVADDNDSDGIVIAAVIDANGGTLRDAAGNDLTLTLNGVASTSAVIVDTTAPDAPAAADLDAASDSGSSD